MYDARVFSILLASPGDTADARDAIEDTVARWNRDRSRREQVVLQTLRWELDAVPLLRGDGQDQINAQLVDEADVVVALFHSRLGSATPRAASGTAEEIERAADRGSRVHVYFSEMPLPRSVDTAELDRLDRFRREMYGRGLVGTYLSLEDLASKVRTALEQDVRALALAAPSPSGAAGPPGPPDPAPARASLRARYAFEREPLTDAGGVTRMRTTNQRLVIENIGTSPATNVSVGISAGGPGDPPILDHRRPIEEIGVNSSASIPVLVHLGVATQWQVELDWQDTSGARHELQGISAL